MRISYDFGHGTGEDRGADGIVNEETEIRKYAPIAIQLLENAGHTCINCTPTQAGLTLDESLSYRTTHANASGSQLHLCFHVNAGGGYGTEIEVSANASATSTTVAQFVLNQICALGFTNRGIKTPDLYVTDHTNMPAILIEPFFCDTQDDCNRYNANALGNAIAKGVIQAVGGNYTSTAVQPQQPVLAPLPANFNEAYYLEVNDDVAIAVAKDEYKSGVYHYQTCGYKENRKCVPTDLITYAAYVQNEGLQNSVSFNEVAGTQGKGLRMEGLTINYTGEKGALTFQGYTQNDGWQPVVNNGMYIGTIGQSKRLESLKINLTGSTMKLSYSVQVENIGWMPYVSNGEVAGTQDKGLRLEAIKIKLE